MNNTLTELVFILDRSGSMGGMEADTIGGFNAMLAKQQTAPGDALISTVLFDHERIVLHDRVPLHRVAPLTNHDYMVRGSTALLDAIGSSICHIRNVHKYIPKEDVPAHTVFVITTDGYENASREFTANGVRRMIKNAKETLGWEFLFLGANIDAIHTAASFGIDASRSANYNLDSRGTRLQYETIGDALLNVREAGSVPEGWSRPIDEDYAERGGRKPRR